MTHSLVMRLSNSNPHTSGAQPPLPPKPAAHPRQSRRQENRSRLRGSPAANICATPAAIPTREYVRLQIGVKERCRPKAGALCHCPLPLPLPPTLPPPLALAAPPAVRQGQTPKRHAYLRTCNVCIRRVNRVCHVLCVCPNTVCPSSPGVFVRPYTMPVHIASATSRLPTFYAIAKNARRHQSGLLHTSTLHSTLQRRVHSAPPSPSCV